MSVSEPHLKDPPFFFSSQQEIAVPSLSFSFSFLSPFSISLASLDRNNVYPRVCACVVRIINRDLFAPTLLILTSGEIFLLGA